MIDDINELLLTLTASYSLGRLLAILLTGGDCG